MIELSASHETVKPRKMWVAVLLHILWWGLGQFYNGKIRRAIVLVLAGELTYLTFSIITKYTESFTAFVMMLILPFAVWVYGMVDTIILTKKYKGSYRPSSFNDRWYKYVVFYLILMIVGEGFSFFIKSSMIEAYKIPSGGMENTLLVGDYLIGKKCNADNIEINDLVIFKYPLNHSLNYIKRCVARSGHTVEIRNKKLYVDGIFVPLPKYVKYEDSRIIPFHKHGRLWGPGVRDNMPPQKIPEGKLFVLGDNRDNSADSRFWGFLDDKLVVGKSMFIHWSWSPDENAPKVKVSNPSSIINSLIYNTTQFKNRVRWDRIGMKLE